MAKKFETKISTKRSAIAERVFQLRKSLGWSQARLAEEFYVTPATIAHWESNKRVVSGSAVKLLEIYELQLKNLNKRSNKDLSR